MQIDYTADSITPDVTTALTIGGTGGLLLSTGSTVQRPATTNGTIRYNTTLNRLEAVIAGSWRSLDVTSEIDAVRVATTAALTLTAPGTTIDGVTMVAGDRVLVKDQTTLSQNGIYVWNGAAVAMTRALDMSLDWDSSVPGRIIFTTEGTTSQFFNFRFVTAFGGTFDTTDITVTGGWWQSGRISFGDSVTPARAATGGFGQRSLTLIDTNAALRTWRFITSTGGNSCGLEMIVGNNDDLANVANTWWDVSTHTDTQDGVRIARRTGGIIEPHFFIDATGRTTIGTTVLASGTTGAAFGSTADVALYINATTGVKMPVGTTAQRPATPTAGVTRFNTDLAGSLEFHNGTIWTEIPSGSRHMPQMLFGALTPATGTSAIPLDNTTPLSTEGTLVWTQAITPRSTSSVVKIEIATVIGFSTTDTAAVLSLFRGTVCIGVQVLDVTVGGGGGVGGTAATAFLSGPVSFNLIDSPASAAAVTYTMRIGAVTGAWFFGRTTGATLGGSSAGNYTVTEIL